jgi:hypothetical protein
MMVLLGHLIQQVCQQLELSWGGCGTTQAALGFGGYFPPAVTGATEEWTGAGAPLTVTITAS